MKQKLPTWVVVASVALVVFIGGFFAVRAASGPGDLPAPKIRVKEAIPEHLKGKMSPEMEAQIKEQTEKYGEIDPNAPGLPADSSTPR